MTQLRTLSIGYRAPTSRSDQLITRPNPQPRVVLPALSFEFRGISEYLEDLVAQIDTPQPDFLRITYCNRFAFDFPQLSQFTGRTKRLELDQSKHAELYFGASNINIRLDCEQVRLGRRQSRLFLQISCQWLDRQVSLLVKVLSHLPGILSNVAHLSIHAQCLQQLELEAKGGEDMVDIAYLDFLRPFTSVEVIRTLGGNCCSCTRGRC